MKNLEELIDSLERKKILITPSIKEAFLKVDRSHFVLEEYKNYAYLDKPLPIEEGQTISQPLTVAFMLELLQVQEGDKVLDVGSGSGWTTALLATIVGNHGQVLAIERIQLLKEKSEISFAKMGYSNILIKHDNGAMGWKEQAPFDRILVNASAEKTPPALLEQLKIGGKLVIPLKDPRGNLTLLEKVSEESYEKKIYPGFVFVPFIED